MALHSSNHQQHTQASAYIVDASTMALTGYHFATSGGGALGKHAMDVVC